MSQDLRDTWDAFAESFERHFERATLQVLRTLVEHGRLGQARDVLELGGGAGGGGLEILARLPAEARFTCTDLSPQMVLRARRRLPQRVEVLEADAQALPFSDGAFDRVVANLNLMIVPDTDRALAETARVLRPGGLYLFSVWGEPERSHQVRVVPELLVELGLPHEVPARSNFHLSAEGPLRARVRAAGFDRVLCAHQQIGVGVLSGEEYAELMLGAHPRVLALLASIRPEQREQLRAAVVQRAEQLLDQGHMLGLDVLWGLARRG